MTKKQEYEIVASQHYIEFQMSIKQIAKKFNLSEKTLFNWKKGGNWEEKRKKYLKSQYSTNQTLYELLHLVANKAVSDFKEEGVMPDQKTLYFIMNMGEKLLKLKQFETNQADEKIEEANQKEEVLETNNNTSQAELLNTFFMAVNGGV